REFLVFRNLLPDARVKSRRPPRGSRVVSRSGGNVIEYVTDDAVLVRRCLAGDEAALRFFVERFQGSLFGSCYRMLRHRQDAEDPAQEVFLSAIRGLSRWQPGRPLKRWLMTTAASRSRAAIGRRMNRRTPAALLGDAPISATAHGGADR